MTADEVRNLPASRDTDALVAVRLGWRWLLVKSDVPRVGLWPPATEEWIRWNLPDDHVDVTGSESGYPRFRDWDRLGSPTADTPRHLFGPPHCSTSIADAWELLTASCLATYAVGRTEDGCWWCKLGDAPRQWANTAPLAIVKAFLTAHATGRLSAH